MYGLRATKIHKPFNERFKMDEENAVGIADEVIGGLSEELICQLEEVALKFQIDNVNITGQLRKSLLVAEGIKKLDALITNEVMAPIMYLRGRKIGFVTDRDNKPANEQYKVAEVKEVFIEATLKGLSPAGNQFNIISSGLYIAKNGYTHLLNQMPGLTDLIITAEPYHKVEGIKEYVVVDFLANWKMKGTPQELSGSVPVHLNNKPGYEDKVDGIMGKADRKIKYRIYCQATNTKVTESDERDLSEVDNTRVKKLTAIEEAEKSVEDESNV